MMWLRIGLLPWLLGVVMCGVLVHPAYGKDYGMSEVQLWLADYTRNRVVSGDVQADSPGGTEDEDEDADPEPQHCPTVRSADAGHDADVSTLACLLPKCDSDADCIWVGQKCCFNGCVDTCVTAGPPPPYIDWKFEPQRDPITGVSWLIRSDEDNEASRRLLHQADHCDVGGRLLIDGQEFTHRHYKCTCRRGLVACDVRATTDDSV